MREFECKSDTRDGIRHAPTTTLVYCMEFEVSSLQHDESSTRGDEFQQFSAWQMLYQVQLYNQTQDSLVDGSKVAAEAGRVSCPSRHKIP